jgi:metal-responsive CopG/Arc/MetJ family transcriptional regulator
MAKIISFSFNEESYLELVKAQKDLGFRGKSETIRSGIKSLLKENEAISKLKGQVSVILVITHSHDANVSKSIHKFEGVVVTHIHQHVKNKCVEIFMLKGNAKVIREIFSIVQKTKAISDAKIVTI